MSAFDGGVDFLDGGWTTSELDERVLLPREGGNQLPRGQKNTKENVAQDPPRGAAR